MAGLPGSWEPQADMPCSPTPMGWFMPGWYGMSMQPFVVLKTSDPMKRSFRGSIARPVYSLSTLRSAGYPYATQDSLPAGSQPLPGGLYSHWVPHNFKALTHLFQVSKLCLAQQDLTPCFFFVRHVKSPLYAQLRNGRARDLCERLFFESLRRRPG
jgi:hypothetical protein